MQADLVVYARQGGPASAPKVGLIIAKTVGSAVQRHRVARRLRHVVRGVLPELGPSDQVVIRTLPGSHLAVSVRLEQQLRAGLERIRQAPERAR